MKLIIAFLILSVGAMASTTRINIPVIGPNGLPARGVAEFMISAACSYGGSYVGMQTIQKPFSPDRMTGITTLSVDLVPNVGTDGTLTGTGACAGTTYSVTWHLDGGVVQPIETWAVPVSATPLTIAPITGPVPAPPAQLQLAQIPQAGATVGQCLMWNGSAWAPGTCGAGGASPAISWSLALTDTEWTTSLTDAQWTTSVTD